MAHVMTDVYKADTARYVLGGSAIEALGGLGAAVLGILGLVGVVPWSLAAVATIGAGGAMLLQGSSLASHYSALAHELDESGRLDVTELGGGLTVELLGGAAGVTLGILALLGVARHPLLATGIILFGATLLIGSGLTQRLSELRVRASGASEGAQSVTREVIRSAAAAQVLVGIGAMALGILALLQVSSLTLVLVALIAVGAAEFFGGTTLSSRTARLLH